MHFDRSFFKKKVALKVWVRLTKTTYIAQICQSLDKVLMPRPKATYEYCSCRNCKKAYKTWSAYLSHRCDPNPGSLLLLSTNVRSMLIDAPRYYQGKVIKPPKPIMSFIFSVWVLFLSYAHTVYNLEPQAWKDDKEKYFKWATSEFIEGREWGPLRASSTFQIIGTITRFLAFNEGWIPRRKFVLHCTITKEQINPWQRGIPYLFREPYNDGCKNWQKLLGQQHTFQVKYANLFLTSTFLTIKIIGVKYYFLCPCPSFE